MSSDQLEKSSLSSGIVRSIPHDNLIQNHLIDKNSFRVNRVSYLSNLTPLRGIAALLTVIFHIDIFLGWEMIPPSGSPLLSHMYLMVDFFFILSGFIMCHVYGNRFLKDVRQKEFKKFTIARFSRVYPLHLFTLTSTIIMLYLFARMGVPKNAYLQAGNNAYSVITNLFLVQAMNFNKWFTWVHASWSISTEWWAYMIFPFLVSPFFKLNARGRIIICLMYYRIYVYLLVSCPHGNNPGGIPFSRSKTDRLVIESGLPIRVCPLHLWLCTGYDDLPRIKGSLGKEDFWKWMDHDRIYDNSFYVHASEFTGCIHRIILPIHHSCRSIWK